MVPMNQGRLLEETDAAPGERRAFDYYPTPAWMTVALLRRVPVHGVFEPCVGEGAITNVLRAHGIRVVLTNDFDPSRPAMMHEDATQLAAWERFIDHQFPNGRFMWTVSNVPFGIADAIVPFAVKHSPYGLAVVLRLSWLEPTIDRQRFLEEYPPTRLIVMPRHKFKAVGSGDSVTCAWFVWEHNRSAKRGIEIVTRMERDEIKAELKRQEQRR
jgi:hypothetical protein